MTNLPCSYSPSYRLCHLRPLLCVSVMSHTWDRLLHSCFLAIFLQAFRSKRPAVLSLPFTNTQQLVREYWNGGYPLRSFGLCARDEYLCEVGWIWNSLLKGRIHRGHLQCPIDEHSLFKQKHRGINDPFNLGRG